MDAQELYALLNWFERSSLTRLKLQDGSFCLDLGREGAPVSVPGPATASPAAPAEPAFQPVPEARESGVSLNAPVVGTFYAAPAPGEAPFVSPGDRVQKGQTVCLLEAMKTMNEVKAPEDLQVLSVLCQDGQLVEYGAPILRYQPLQPCSAES